MFVLASTTLQSTFSLCPSLSSTLLLFCCLQSDTLFVCLARCHCFPLRLAHRCRGGMMLKRADHQRGDKRARPREHWIQLTCCSVQDLGLKEYAGVFVRYAGEEQSLRLYGTSGYDDLETTPCTILDQWMWTMGSQAYFCNELHSKHCRGNNNLKCAKIIISARKSDEMSV